MEFTAIITAAGSGTRMGLEFNKIFLKINGKRVIDYSIEFFENYPFCKEIVLVSSDADFNFMYDQYHHRVTSIVVGGRTRQESVFKALNKAKYEYVLIHDAARPYISSVKIDHLVKDMVTTSASTLAVSVVDTIVKTSGNRLNKTLDRNELVAIQTPQAFFKDLLLDAHRKARNSRYQATDDTDLIRRFTTVMPSYVEGDYRSIKLTTKEDIPLLEVIL
ncbi:2-C-methyl-D-erythritol 4-phosphate cytidylyltransferase [Candidatus Xianfuyuplasma coldseepsis]|uniref:2-C-methyl-D-erythritol 4-phosphate cytidylyltransferase n=1 Tax=Candidatus Xianfuyuplasma coldseepsis TaxID=2782163 RepID=A0A7L7KT10_9MOLU|nr:2-C-methyl-D-erythritol 4-phosphate cytidylyltransferase [Xianfuyuplasma coldseepsis]QMS84908.1 2-C-methyl-D-erythritol 4-phosphate cytidylyltransferase [Xianfuyuplasma coldseepsis]